MTAERLMLLGGFAAFALTLYWVRQRHLTERHALGWMVVATVLLVCGLFPELVTRAAEASHLSYSSAVLFVSLGIGYVFSFGVTVAYAKLNRRQVTLLQHLAILEQRVRELEAGNGRGTDP